MSGPWEGTTLHPGAKQEVYHIWGGVPNKEEWIVCGNPDKEFTKIRKKNPCVAYRSMLHEVSKDRYEARIYEEGSGKEVMRCVAVRKGSLDSLLFEGEDNAVVAETSSAVSEGK